MSRDRYEAPNEHVGEYRKGTLRIRHLYLMLQQQITDLPDDDLLAKLLALNLSRAGTSAAPEAAGEK